MFALTLASSIFAVLVSLGLGGFICFLLYLAAIAIWEAIKVWADSPETPKPPKPTKPKKTDWIELGLLITTLIGAAAIFVFSIYPVLHR